MSGDWTDHAATARALLDRLDPTPPSGNGPALGRGYWSMYEAAQVDALRGIGHALLAIAEALGAGDEPTPCKHCDCLTGVQQHCCLCGATAGD